MFQWLTHDHTGSSDVKQQIKDDIIEAIVREAENLQVGCSAGAAESHSAESRDPLSAISPTETTDSPLAKKPRLFANYARSSLQPATSVKSPEAWCTSISNALKSCPRVVMKEPYA